MERGYNQTDLIIKEVIKQINKLMNNKNSLNIAKRKIVVINNFLIKIKDNKRQSDLNKQDRINNVKDVYRINNNLSIKDFKNKRILIFDDIYTTGNTVNECVRIINKNLKCKISIFTLAKD